MKSNGFPILGIEGGGTKTTWALIGDDGAVLREGITTAGNIQHLSDAQIAALFKSIHTAVGPNVRAIGGAFAGCHLPAEKAQVEAALRKLWPNLEQVIAGEDTRSAFAGAHGTGDGIIVIAGTGSNVQGHKGGQWEKAVGWGTLCGDYGSGYDFSRLAFERIFRVYDHTHTVGILGREFLRQSGQNSLPELVPWIHARENKTDIAAFTPSVFAAAQAGDKVAQALVDERSGLLADAVVVIAKRLGLTKPDIGLVGSLFEKSSYYFRIFEKAVRKRMSAGKIFVSSVPGAVGAARMLGGVPVKAPASAKAKAVLPQPVPAFATATTEARNPRSAALDKKGVAQLVDLFVAEETEVHKALRAARPQLAAAATAVAAALKGGHRLFYVGAGTSGRLGVLDASEMPPTFNVPPDLVQGIIAGGNEALVRSQEGAEDDAEAGAMAVVHRGVAKGDVVIGITASGSAPFVRGALEQARKLGANTYLLTCNPKHTPLRGLKGTIVLATGPELITGSTRLKAGTATKLALNLFSSIGMIRSGRVRDNLMINVQPTNEKLRHRARRLVEALAGVGEAEALQRLAKTRWDVAKAIGGTKKKAKARR
jgi:N-acetylmuramic acid 6-phosphate etherase